MNVKYTVITYDNVSDTFSISEDDNNASEDNQEEEEVEELCHDLFKDFAPTQKYKRAKKSNDIPIGATSTKRLMAFYGCKEKLEELASYVVLCGGKRDLLEGWSATYNTSKRWHYESKTGTRFKSRPEVARWLNLPDEPDVQSVRRLSQVSKKRKR